MAIGSMHDFIIVSFVWVHLGARNGFYDVVEFTLFSVNASVKCPFSKSIQSNYVAFKFV